MGFSKPEAKNVDNLPVRLVLCFDGTGDTAEGSFSAVDGKTVGKKDSIRTIYDMAKSGPVTDSNGKKAFQFVQYFEGVGTVGVSTGAGMLTRAAALFDGATGHGYLDILRNGYKVCCQQLQYKDMNQHEIFIFGFSRGAFISRALASFLQHVGLIKAEFLDKDESQDKIFQAKFRELVQRYVSLTTKPSSSFPWTHTKIPMADRSKDLLPFCIPSPRVRLIGAFDTVKTVIPLPIHNYISNGVPNIDFEMDAPGIVDHFRHALALNEARPLFNPDLWKSDANSADSSYLEAWFFGYHHDIGGGGQIQGLALWPLQWILHAATDYGLALDPEVEPYDVLFTGSDNMVETPHDIALKMFDMILHHKTEKSWGLRLNQPSSLMAPEPRNYFEYLTKPPYLKLIKPKVFLHPSAYLVFDISSSFRIQVYQWKHFRTFLKDRTQALHLTTTPWWEQQTVESILKENTAAERLNLLVMGRPGAGKADMVGQIFGRPSDLMKHDISTPVSIPGNNKVCIYYSNGFGPDCRHNRASVEKFLEDRHSIPDIDNQIHAMWYFLDCTVEAIPDSEKELFQMDFGQIPVLVILQNEDKLREKIQEEIVDKEWSGELDILVKFNEKIDALKAQLKGLPVRTYVQARNRTETPKNLLTETALCFEDESVHIAQIKAQRMEVKPKIALATEESVRAYTIWHSFKSSAAKFNFNRNKDPTGMDLSMLLMEPIMATFNMRFSGDAALVKSRIGTPWKALEKHKSGLWDTSLPGDLILMCMLDTIIVMTYALSRRQSKGMPDGSKDKAQPLSAVEIEQACTWYTNPKENKQEEMHKSVRELLDQDGLPKGKSVANFQMDIIETVEHQSGDAEAASALGLIGGALKWVSGWW